MEFFGPYGYDDETLASHPSSPSPLGGSPFIDDAPKLSKIVATLTTQEFVDQLSEHRLLDEPKIERIRKIVNDDTSIKKLCSQLIDKKWLTRWQVKQLLKGRESFLLGRFLLLERLASHSRGTAYRAQDTEADRIVRLDVFQGGGLKDHPAPRRVVAQFRKAQAFQNPGIVQLFELDEQDSHSAIVSEWVESDAPEMNDENPKSLQDSVKGDKKRVASLIRQLALTWSHAHDKFVYDRMITPSQIVTDKDDKPRIQLYGVPAVREVDSTWDAIDPYNEKDDEHPDGAAVGVCHDIRRLGRIGHYLLTGSTEYDAEEKPVSRLEIVFRSMIESTPGRGIVKMDEIVKLIQRWERANGETSSSDEDSGNQALSEIDEAAKAMAAFAQAANTTQDSDKESDSFELGPRKENSEEDEEEPVASSSGFKLSPPIVLTFAGVAAFIVLIATSVTVFMMLKDPNAVDSSNQVAESTNTSANAGNGADNASEDEDSSDEEGTDDGSGGGLLNGEEVNTFAGNDDEANADNNDAAGNDAAGNDADQANANDQTADADAGQNVAANGDDSAQENNDEGPDSQTPDAGNPAGGESEAVANNENSETTETTDAEPDPMERAKSFAGLPRVFAVPEVGEPEAPVEGYQNEVAIGDVNLIPGELLFVDLLGGDKAFRSRSKFFMQVIDDRAVSFKGEIRVAEKEEDAAAGQLMATVSIREGKLYFQWADQAHENVAAPYFKNCLLVFKTGTDTAPVAFRAPIKLDPLQIDEAVAKGDLELELTHLPRPDVIRVRLVKVPENFPAYMFRDNETDMSAANGSIFLDYGGAQQIGMFTRIESSVRRELDLKLMTYYIDGRRPEVFNATILERKIGEANFARQKLDQDLANFAKLSGEQKKQLPGVEQELRATRDAAKREFDRLSQINNFVSQLDGAKLTFRVYVELDGYQIDLATPDGKVTPEETQGFAVPQQ